MKLLSYLRIRTKLASMVCLAALTVGAIITISSFISKSRMMEDRVQQMQAAADLFYGLAQSFQDDVTAGKMTLDEAKAQLRQRGKAMKFGGGQGYPVVYNSDTSILVNGGNPKLEGKITGATDSNGVVIADAIMKAGSQSERGGVASYLYPRPGQTEPVRKTVFARKFAPWNAVISYGVYVDDIDADLHAVTLQLAAIGFCLVLLMALLSWLIARDVLGALDRQKNRMQEIAAGNLDRPVQETDRGDEIGRMAETLEVLRQTGLAARALEAEQIATKTRSESEKRDSLVALADRFDASVGQLVGLMVSGSGNLETTAKSMTSTAEGTNQRAAVVGSAATQASQRVQTVAAAAEELSSSITEISRQIAQSAEVTSRAVESSRRTDTIVRALSDGAQQIEHVAELISTIAAQTNLLALNATIEAARAGDAGRGFAVVAQEVETLAGQTAKATDEISNQIASMQLATEESVVAIKAISQTIERISGIAGSISAAVEQQKSATQNIVASVRAAVSGTADVAVNVRQAAEGANETGETSSPMFASAQALSGESLHLKAEVDGFLERVHAA
jgi:methyl-accepting chemotaxis protein